MTHGPSNVASLVTGWKERAACAGYPSAVFFPGADASSSAIERARSVCRVCPVGGDCLEYAFETNQTSGIWGGTTAEERKSLRRKWLATRRRSA